jgi:hypothetical protein
MCGCANQQQSCYQRRLFFHGDPLFVSESLGGYADEMPTLTMAKAMFKPEIREKNGS